MHLNNRLAVCGMHNVIDSIAVRGQRMQIVGIDIDPYSLMTHEERATLERVESKARELKGVRSQNDVLEFDRLTVLIGRLTGESITWLRRLSLQRLRGMMDGLES